MPASSQLKAGRHSDGGGLYLNVTPGGSKSWVFMWNRDGKRREMLRQLGRIGLKEAEQDEQLGAFWSAVQLEMLRQTRRGGQRPGGDAA